MPTAIDIASNALVMIGDEPISSFEDPGAGALVASAIYSNTYRSLIASHPWTFSLKEQFLSRLTAEPDAKTNFKYAFQLPADLIRIWKIMSHSNYDQVGSLIYSNENELLCRYGYQVDETDLPPHFVQALEYKLASDFAISVTEDLQKSQYFEQKFINQSTIARSVDSQGHPQRKIVDSPFIDVRASGKGYNWGGYY